MGDILDNLDNASKGTPYGGTTQNGDGGDNQSPLMSEPQILKHSHDGGRPLVGKTSNLIINNDHKS